MRNEPGYTLIELMVVVILVALISALAVPQITQAARNTALVDLQNEVAVAMRKARGMAARNGVAYRIHVNANPLAKAQLVRIDEGNDATCYDFDACTEVAPAYGGAKCGVAAVRVDNAYYQRNAVKMTLFQTKAGATVYSGTGTLDVCVTPFGRVHHLAVGGTCGNCIPTPVVQPVVVAFDRYDPEYVGGPIGVRRCVIMPERGLPRLTFGAGCP